MRTGKYPGGGSKNLRLRGLTASVNQPPQYRVLPQMRSMHYVPIIEEHHAEPAYHYEKNERFSKGFAAFEVPADAHYTDLLIKAEPRENVPLPAFPAMRGKVTTIDNTRGVQMKLGKGKVTQVGFERHHSSNVTRGVPVFGKHVRPLTTKHYVKAGRSKHARGR
jgi:hypothetical protein